MKNKNERTMNMTKNKNDLKTSSLIPHLSYLKRKTVCRFTLIELLVKTACFNSDLAVDQGMRYERGEMR